MLKPISCFKLSAILMAVFEIKFKQVLSNIPTKFRIEQVLRIEIQGGGLTITKKS